MSRRRVPLALARRRLEGLAQILDAIHRPAEAVAARNVAALLDDMRP